MYVRSEFNIADTYSNEFIIDLDRFIANIFGEVILSKAGHVCINSGW